MANLSRTTWRYKSGLASWDFQVLGMPNGSARIMSWYASTVMQVIKLLQGFARPEAVRLTTASGGENAWVIDVTDADGLSRLAEVLTSIADLEDVEISLTLLCRSGADANEIAEIPGGATLWLTLEQDADDRPSPLRLLFSLHADVYAVRTWGQSRDNATLAALNAPRIEQFLRGIEAALPAVLMEFDAPSYQDQAYAYGFRIP